MKPNKKNARQLFQRFKPFQIGNNLQSLIYNPYYFAITVAIHFLTVIILFWKNVPYGID